MAQPDLCPAPGDLSDRYIVRTVGVQVCFYCCAAFPLCLNAAWQRTCKHQFKLSAVLAFLTDSIPAILDISPCPKDVELFSSHAAPT